MTKKRIPAPAWIVALALGCAAQMGAGAAAAGATSTSRKPVTHTITIDAARFSPSDLTVKTGDTIVWVNKDILAHTATAKSGQFDSKVIQPGKSWKYVVRKRGNVAYTCSFHPMDGTLTIK